MTDLELITPLEAADDDQERFARDLADDLQGDRVTVVWDMVQEEIFLAKRRET